MSSIVFVERVPSSLNLYDPPQTSLRVSPFLTSDSAPVFLCFFPVRTLVDKSPTGIVNGIPTDAMTSAKAEYHPSAEDTNPNPPETLRYVDAELRSLFASLSYATARKTIMIHSVVNTPTKTTFVRHAVSQYTDINTICTRCGARQISHTSSRL